MERFGRIKIEFGINSQYCSECGSPELEDGCTNSGCWRARPNARLPVSLMIQQMAIRKSFPSGEKVEGFMGRCLHILTRPLFSHGSLRPSHAGKPA